MSKLRVGITTLVSLFASFSVFAEAGIDERINLAIKPFADAVAGFVFSSFPVAGVQIPFVLVWLIVACVVARAAPASVQPDWAAFDAETLRHFQALVRMDTTDPPGREQEAAEYLAEVLEAEGIPVEVFALETHRPNVVARLKGNGSRLPILVMALVADSLLGALGQRMRPGGMG